MTPAEYHVAIRKAKAEYEGGNKSAALAISATLAPFIKANPVSDAGFDRAHHFKLMMRYLKYEIACEAKGITPWMKG